MRRVLALCMVAFIALPMATASQVQPFHAMTNEEFASFLDSILADIPRWKLLISKIDVTELRLINYEEGKQIEGFQNVCLQNLDQIEFDVSALKRKHSVIFLISLLAHTDDFHHDLDLLENSIGIRAFPERTAQDIPKTRKWADGLFGISKDIYPLRARLLEHSLAVAVAADALLNAPPPSR